MPNGRSKPLPAGIPQAIRSHRCTIRLGYLVSFPLLLICALLLILDLGVPLRFWHMVIRART